MARRKTSAKGKASQPAATPSPKAPAGDKLYTDQIRQLVDLMVANDLTTLEIVNGDLRVALGRGAAAALHVSPAGQVAVPKGPAVFMSGEGNTVSTVESQAVVAAGAPAEKLHEIKSPMVGTFYAAPSPDSDAYVTAGARITPDTVVCIIEAMKVMNEIKAECSGAIVEVAVENGRPVEYGQALFRVRP